MDRRCVIAYFIFSFCFPFLAHSQVKAEICHLQNPSFEGIPKSGEVPSRWENSGTLSESPPDIQPYQFGVSKLPHNGNTYLGLVVRDNDTYESVSQRLTTTIKEKNCYKFSIWLCRSEFYNSQSSVTKKPANYSLPVRFNIYGGNNVGHKLQLLGSVEEVQNTEWKEYFFEFKARQNYSYITLESAHKKPTLFPYNGNVLVDQMSDIVPIKCDEKALAKVDKIKKPNPEFKRPDTGVIASTTPTKPTNIPTAYDTKPLLSSTYDRKKMKIGQTIRIEKLYFDADSIKLNRSAYPVLNELYQFMSSNTDVNIEVGGHTNDTPAEEFCDRLSTSRARAVAEYLILKGIHESRVLYRGYGKRNPLFPNTTTENRKRNQRVEIKILSIG
jgi:outer membrane protein OmpA-like peptidoglycan-associated protein